MALVRLRLCSLRVPCLRHTIYLHSQPEKKYGHLAKAGEKVDRSGRVTTAITRPPSARLATVRDFSSGLTAGTEIREKNYTNIDPKQ